MERDCAAVHAGRSRAAAALGQTSNTRWRKRGAERLWHLLHGERIHPEPGRAHRQPGGAAGAGRAEGHLPQRLAGGGRRQLAPGRCIPTRACIPPTACPRWCARSTTPCMRADQIQPARRASGTRIGSRPSWPTPRPGFGGIAERFRVDESHDRSRRGGGPL